jgi:hypothetical protein
MTSAVRAAVVVIVVVSLVAGGPLAPLAFAQPPTAPPPAPTPQPGIFPETLKAPDEERVGVDGRRALHSAAYEVGAGVATAFLVPGRVVTCIVGSGFGVAFLVLTFGTAYRFAMNLVEEGCGGKWVVEPTDLMPEAPPITTTPEPR